MGKPWEKAAAASPRPAKPWEKAAQSANAPGALEPMGGASGQWDLSKFEALPRQPEAAPTPLEAARARNDDAIAAMTGGKGGASVYRQPEAPRLLARPGGRDLVPTMDSRKAPFVAGRDNASALSAMTKGAQSTPDETKAPVGYRTIMTPDGTRVMGYQRNTPTMLPEERTALAEGNRREEQASRDRREAASAFGGGMDLMPTVDESGNVRPGSPSDQDIGKGVTTAPVRVERGVVAGVEGIANLPSDFLNAMATAQAQEVTQAQANRNANRMPQLQARVGQGPQKAVSYPRFDFNGAKIPITPELDSLTGQFTEGLAQYLVARKLIGAAAPGGGIAPELGKDAAATFASTDGKTGRLADMIPSSSVPEGPMRQWLDFLKTRPDDDPLLGRFKNTLEDLTISGPMVAPHLAVRGGQAVYNRLNPSAGPVTPQPPMPPAARPAPGANQTAPGPQPIPGGAAMATQTTTAGQQFSGAYRDGGKWSVNYRPVPLSDGSLALVREMTDETGTTVSHLSQDGEWVKGEPAKTRVSGMRQLSGPETFNSADQALAAARDDASGMGGQPAGASSGQPPPRTATAVPPTPPRPQAASAGAPPPAGPPAVIAPAAAGAPPPGVLTPVPPGGATTSFNALPQKTREAVIRAMEASGMKLPDIQAAIRDLDNMPADRSGMYATELILRHGADYPMLAQNLEAMGGKFATEAPMKPKKRFGLWQIETDGAREVMDNNVRAQLDSLGQYVKDTSARLFGPGAVPTREVIDQNVNAIRGAYQKILDPRKPYGNLRAPAKVKKINDARQALTAYLKKVEKYDGVPDWIRTDTVNRLNRDLRESGLPPLEDGPITEFMWQDLIEQYPTQIAHALQSSYATAAREAGKSLDMQAGAMARNFVEKRGRSAVRVNAAKIEDRGYGLLHLLEEATPGYKETRLAFGNEMGAIDALTLPERFLSVANDEVKLKQFIDDLDELTPDQFKAAKNQITTLVNQSIGKKVANPKLSDLRPGEQRYKIPNLTQVGNENVLAALPKAFGKDGEELANAILLARGHLDELGAIHPRVGSPTAVRTENIKGAGRLYEHPAASGEGIVDKVTAGLGAAGGLAAVTNPALAPPLLAAAGVRAAMAARKAGKALSPAEKTALADWFFHSRNPGGAPGGPPSPVTPPGPRGPRLSGPIANTAIGAGVGGTIGYTASGGDPNATAAGVLAGAGVGGGRSALKARASARSLIPEVRGPRTASLASPSKPPPVKAGFGFGGPPKSLDMSEPARMRRAREQGFDVETPYYHGTNRARDIEEFDLGRAGQQSGSGEVAVFLSDSPERANSYANAQMKHQEPTPEGWEKTKKVFGYTDDQLRDRWLRDAPSPAVFKTYVRGPTREVDWLAENGGDPAFNSVTMKRLIAEEHKRGKDARNLRIRNMADGGNDPSATTMVVLDPRNVRATTASFDPSQSGSSKLLDSFGATPETLGVAALGGAGGAAYAQDDNKDGVIDLSERLKYAAGGAFGTTVASGMVRQVGRALGPPKAAARSVESGAVRSFTARDGTQYAVHIDDAGHVSFNANSGPKAPRNALKDEFKPTGTSSLAEANEVFAGVEKAIRDDIAETGRSRYVLNGRTPRQRELYAQMAQRKQPPEGYRWEVSDKGVALRKTTEAPVSRDIDMTPDGYERTTQIGNAKLTYAVQPDGAMTIEMIDVPPAARGKGEAGAALDKLLAEADANGSTVYLDPKPVGQGGLTAAQLQDFYRKRGFTKQQGSPGLVRSPMDAKDPGRAARKPEAVPATPIRGELPDGGRSISIGRIGNQDLTGALYSDPTEGLSFHPNYPASEWNDLGDAAATKLGKAPSTLKRMITPEGGPGLLRMTTKKTGVPKWSERNVGQIAEEHAPAIDEAVRNRFIGLVKSNPNAPKYSLELDPKITSQDTRKALIKLARETDRVFVEVPDDTISLIDRNVFNQTRGRYRRAYTRFEEPGLPPIRTTQNSFGFGGSKPPGNRMGPPKVVKPSQEILPPDANAGPPKPGQGPYRMEKSKKTSPPMSRREAALRAEVKNAQRAENRARSSPVVIRDQRDDIIKPKWDRRVRAETRLSNHLENRAKWAATKAGVQDFLENGGTGKKIAIGASVPLVGALGMVGYNALLGDRKEAPANPNDPRYYWDRIASQDKEAVSSAQMALQDWGVWAMQDKLNNKGEPIILTNGKKAREPIPVTGSYGRVTKDAIKRWRHDRGLNPEDPMTQSDLERLLAGPKGYWENGHWRRGDGSVPKIP